VGHFTPLGLLVQWKASVAIDAESNARIG
jgi:hypothetical protein